MFARKFHNLLCSEDRPSYPALRLVQDGTRDTTPEVLAAS